MNTENNIVKGLLILLVFYVVQIVGSILYLIIASVQRIDPIAAMYTIAGINSVMLALLISQLTIVILLAFRYKSQIMKSLKYVATHKKEMIIKLVIYTVTLLAALLIASLLDSLLFSQYSNVLGENEELLQMVISDGITVPTFLVIALVGPFFEEYVFRYGLMTKILGMLNKYVAAIISTVIFAFIHIGFAQIVSNQFGYTMHLFLMYIPISLVISLVYAREENLMLPIAIHIINNTLSILVSVYGLYLFI